MVHRHVPLERKLVKQGVLRDPPFPHHRTSPPASTTRVNQRPSTGAIPSFSTIGGEPTIARSALDDPFAPEDPMGVCCNRRSLRVRLLPHPHWRRRCLKTHPGLRRP